MTSLPTCISTPAQAPRRRAAPRRQHLRSALALAAAAALGPFAMAPASAASCTFNTASGNWAAIANWASCTLGNGNPAGAPGAADTATIGATRLVTINTGQQILNLNNAGQINIDAFGLNLVGGGSTNNTGVINIGGPSTANLGVSAGHNIDNAGGTINIAAGSVLNQFGSTISGGNISTSGTGALVVFSNGNNVLSNVALTGVMDMTTNANARQRIAGGMVLNGAINVASGGILSLDSTSIANQTLSGSGTINLNDPGARLAIEGNGVTTLASGFTVRGQGNIGAPNFAGGTNTLVNNGLISADVNGGTLTITAPGNNGSLANAGTLLATGGGTLQLQTNVNNAGGQITAATNSVVVHGGTTISGGAIGSAGTGVFRVASNGNNVLTNVTLTGVMDMTTLTNARQRIVGGSVINGSVNIAGGGILSLDSTSVANQTIGGTGTINLNDAGARLAVEGAGTTTLASGLTVRGQGNIGQPNSAGGNNVLTNNGLISADVNGGTLNLVTPASGGSFVNNGTLQAVGGGSLLLSTNITANSGSQIVAGAGSSVVQNGVRINGVINASGTGVFSASSSGNNVLDGVSFSGTLDMASITNSRQRIVGGGTFNGTINIANGGILSLDSTATPDQAIAGTVTINLNDAGARLAVEGAGSTLLGTGVTVRGQGNIGQPNSAGGNNVLTNNGLISADVAGGTLNITTPASSGSFINGGTLQAVSGGTLLLSTNITANSGSQIIAGAGSSVVQNGVRITGVLNASGSGTFSASSSGSNLLEGVTLTGVLDMSSIVNSRERVAGGLTLNGAINVAGGGILSLDSTTAAGPNQTIGGTGSINLNDPGARLALEGTGVTTLGSNIVVRGQGNVGTPNSAGGNNVLVNNGRISADVSGGTLTITAPANGGSVTNNNTLQATAGGTLVLQSTINNAGGLITAANGSVVRQDGVTITGGTIASAGTGALRIASSGNNVLTNVTLTGVMDMTTIVNARQRIVGGSTINGSVNIGNGGILSLDSTSVANQTIGGTGSINLNDPGARLAVEGTGNTTLATGLTVRGQGNIGQPNSAGGNNVLTNNGTILADGGTLSIVPPANGGSLNGSGTLQVAGGTLSLATGSASTQGRLVMGATGSFATNSQNLTLGTDYTSAQWSSGNSFNRRAGITGTGQILAGGNAAMNFTGSGVTGGATGDATLTIGNVRVGSTTFNYQLANVGTTGPTLRGAIQTSVNGGNLTDTRLSGAGVTASNFSTGAPGSNSGNLGVTFTVASAGPLGQLVNQRLNYTSNFENVADQKLNFVVGSNAAAFNAAVGSAAPTPVQLAAQRVGGTLTQVLTVANTAVGGAFSEDLNASFSGFTGGVSGSGSIGGRLAGTNNTGTGSMSVGLDTSTSGAKAGTATLAYVTAGAVNGVSNGLGTAAVGTQTINVSGNVYAPAVPLLNTTTVNFGTVRVGTVVTAQGVSVSNTASGALTDTLRATLAGGASPFSTAGTVTALAAGGTNAGSLTVGLNTAAAGVFNSNGTVTFTSQNPEMADLARGTGNVALQATVNNIAAPALAKTSGAGSFSGSGTSYTLNLGTLQQGGGTVSTLLSLANLAAGPADALAGSFVLSALSGTPFSALSGFGSFSGVAGGGSLAGGLSLGFNTNTLGSFSSSITLNPRSTNASQADLALDAITLTLQGNVAAVPEPGTWALWLAGLAVLGQLARRQDRRAA